MATARSVRPSPLKSPATRASGAVPAAYRTWSWKVPSPLPSSTDTSLEPSLATARSVRPSPLKSPATRALGAVPRRVSHLVLEGAVAVAQQHRHVVGAVVGDGQVGAAVAVEVPRHEGAWRGPRRVPHLVLEGAVAVAQQHRHVVGAVVGDGQVGAAVAVEVPRHEGVWRDPRRVPHLVLEGAVAVAQQHRHVVGAVVGDGQVGAAVAVEVPRHEGVWRGPRRVPHLVLEGAVAVAQQHRHVVGVVVGDGQVGAAVAVEVPRHEGDWRGPRRVPHLVLEGAVAVAQQHRHVVGVVELATARSVRPSPLKSPATRAFGDRPRRGSAETVWWLASMWSSRCRRPRRRGFPPRDSRSPPGHAGRSGRRGCRVTGRRSEAGDGPGRPAARAAWWRPGVHRGVQPSVGGRADLEEGHVARGEGAGRPRVEGDVIGHGNRVVGLALLLGREDRQAGPVGPEGAGRCCCPRSTR